MYRNKKDVDKHVENLISKLSEKEFKVRAYSVARFYYEVGDYVNCQKYVEQYLTQKDNNAAAYKLLGQALQKVGQKEKALEQYKTSLDIDPSQTSTILDICELLADSELVVEPGRAKYWCEKAEAIFPRHPVTFRLRERLVTISNPDPEALVNLLIAELAIRPKDVLLHVRLVKHYLNTNQYKKAFEHSSNVEFSRNNFLNSCTWYEALCELVGHNSHNINDWLYQLLLLTVRERICVLSLTETPNGTSKSLIESNDLLHAYDQAIENVARAGATPGFAEFHASLLQHHRGQFAFHAATFLLKKAKKDQLNWKDATKWAAPLMLIAWHTVPLDSKVNWLRQAPEKQLDAVNRWYSEGMSRCSQSGHYLLSNIKDKSQMLINQISECCSGSHWRDKLYEKIFTSRSHLTKIQTSHLVSNAFSSPILRLPRKIDVETYDCDVQRQYGNSLHHFVWTLLNYKNLANFKCVLFDMLQPSVSSNGPETLNKLDIHAFLYSAALTARQQKSNKTSYIYSDKPTILPANITDLLCPLPQMKWWDCAYKFSQNELGTELTDIRATLSRGIEVVRCIDNHGLDPELLCHLGHIFAEQAKLATDIDEKNNLQVRAGLYYASAIPLLDKLKNKVIVNLPEKRMFDYTHKELGPKELNSLIEESKLYVAMNHFNDGEYEKVIAILSHLKAPLAYYHISQSYKKIAFEEPNYSTDSETKSKFAALLSKAKTFAYKALDRLKESDTNKSHPLYADTYELLESIETQLNKLDLDLSGNIINDVDDKYSSDETVSAINDYKSVKMSSRVYRNLSSTPKASAKQNNTNYRTAVDTQFLESTHVDQQFLERIEKEIKNLQKRDTTINDFMEKTKDWFEENRKLGNQIITTINSNIQNTTDQFKLLKISVDQVKDQIDECRNECKDVGDLKKQVAELKKEVNKLKKTSDQAIDVNDLYNLEDEYRTNENTSNFAQQLPFTPQVLPPFNQRLVPPFPVPANPFQFYGQSLYNLCNQYSQLAQTSSVAGGAPIFDPARPHVNYPGVYATPDQMFLDVAHLVPPNVPVAPTIPTVPVAPILTSVPTMPNVPAVPVPPPTATTVLPKSKTIEAKEISRSLPENVVITSSDPLPTCTTTPAPILSVTIPPKHIKGTPHNYQIAMPPSNETKTMSSPVFGFPMPGNKQNMSATASPLTNWNQSNIFKTNQPLTPPKFGGDVLDESKSVVDGAFFDSSHNNSLNKSRTVSERSNTSIENYDPCPDFKPIVPLPAEVSVITGEENETAIFSSRAKLFRFTSKQWKERGLGEMKLLKHNVTGKVRVLMRREQVHKICANHIITPEMEITPMQNETKAYFWVANDFADEVVVLEKFCIRFKTADIAKEFYDIFEKARQESAQQVLNTIENKDPKLSTPVKSPELDTAPVNKAVIGGFTFSSTPTFKTVTTDAKSEQTASEPPTSKINVFSGLSFKTNSSSPFSNIFNTNSAQTAASNSTTTIPKGPSNMNTSDTVDEFEPNVEFKPVVPLPALVDQKTGEEDENILFEHRAKLLRFEASTKEWKERGLGNIKLLVNKDNVQKLRLLMRREQIMKVCCNHAITRELVFQKMPNMDKAVTWCAKDFSEGELVAETFCLRFKTVQTCDEFMDAVKTAQAKLMDDSKAAKEELNAAKQSTQANSTKTTPSGWGDAFKPKPGSWECKECFIRNEPHIENCTACNSPKDPSKAKSEPKPTATTDFKFGISTVAAPAKSGWGDKFKPKEGTWECQQCLVRNDSNVDQCSACNSPKDPNAPKPESKSIFGTATASSFKFGIPATASSELKPEVSTSSIFDGTGAHKFSFGIPLNISPNVATFGEQKTPVTGIFGVTKTSTDSDKPLNFILKKEEDNLTCTPTKPALLPTPHVDSTPNTTFGAKESGTFDFVFKPKTPTKGKSPAKSLKNEGDDSDGNEYVSDDDGVHIHFSPVVPMPEKVQVVTGEENEVELYGHRAKLFRFLSGEWKERGIGVIKILKHKDTGKVRIVMRREQVLKICLNHALTSDVTYTAKDDKSWHFVANDFSEGELSLQHFCIRFKTKEIAHEFKDAVEKARCDKFDLDAGAPIAPHDAKETDSDDVIFVSEIQATSEEKQKAKELMLPENFFTYKNKEPCAGCRGCSDDVASKGITDPSPTLAIAKASVSTGNTGTSTPVRSSIISVQTPTNSVYGTPTNLESNTSIFRTPLTSIGSNTKNTNSSSTSSAEACDSIDKENTFINKSNIFRGFGEPKSIFGTAQSKPGSIFGAGDTTLPVSSKNSVLAPPKLSTVNTSLENQSHDVKSIFGTTQNKSIFSDAKPIFGDSKSILDSTNSGTGNQTPEFKSVFGDNQKPVNFFSGVSQGSIFGPISNSAKPATGIFGSTNAFSSGVSPNSVFGSDAAKSLSFDTSTSQGVFGGGKSIFETAGNQTSMWKVGSNTEQKTPEVATNTTTEKVDNIKEDETAKKDTLFNVDNNLSFAALSSTGSEGNFTVQKKTDFKWEGAGQQLFGTQKHPNKDGDNSTNESGALDSTATAGPDEDYDPHYEPIVPLPDKIVVTTGEEDEEKVFGERAKLYRYDEKTREWKERGVGEMKVLYHPGKNTYRLLLRREQVHKAVLNMLLFADLELLPMKNSDRAWTWAGRNFAEPTGDHETLAVRFKSVDLATAFQQRVVDCVRKIQAAAAKAIREEKESSEKFESVAPLRLPKHLEVTARVDSTIEQAGGDVQTQSTSTTKPNGEVNQASVSSDMFKQVHFQEPEEHGEDNEEEEDEEYRHDDYDNQDYDAYYNEEEEESAAYYSCDGEAVVRQGATEAVCPHAHIQVLFDQELYSPKILVTDSVTGEILADMVIHTDTEFQMSGDTCSWSGQDYTSNDPVYKTVSVNFYDSDTAMQFYDSCETSKAATYSSTDPES